MAFKDECGVFGIWPAAEASRKAYLGLYASSTGDRKPRGSAPGTAAS